MQGPVWLTTVRDLGQVSLSKQGLCGPLPVDDVAFQGQVSPFNPSLGSAETRGVSGETSIQEGIIGELDPFVTSLPCASSRWSHRLRKRQGHRDRRSGGTETGQRH